MSEPKSVIPRPEAPPMSEASMDALAEAVWRVLRRSGMNLDAKPLASVIVP